MCGIAGFVTREAVSAPERVLARMTGAIHHRGPDEDGSYQVAPAWLGHKRLSIIDLASGQQPMSNEDQSLWVVYNGEIFNHADLRPELEAAGHRYHTHCDTETILHSYEQYGPDSVNRFRGMFAYAIWNTRTQELFCVRDRLGIKPLYYYWDGRTFVFGSEIKALLEHPAVSAQPDESTFSEYLAFGYTSTDRTMFKGIRKLMPGHWLRLSFAGAEPRMDIRQYWDIPARTTPEQKSDAEWIAECRRRLEETVRMRLMSDVPLGMFLSGGVDSSAIAGLMKRMVTEPVKTFSVGYAEAEFSELGYASDTARAIGTDHHEVRISMDDFFGALPKLVWHEDEPITWPSSISLYFVAKLASENVKVVLTGEGSDELFAGYSRYRFYRSQAGMAQKWGVLPNAVRTGIRQWVAGSSLLSATMRRKAQHTFVGRRENLESLYIDNFYSAFSAEEQQTMLRSANTAPSPYAAFQKYWNSRNGSSLLQRMLYSDQKTYLVELLMKQDQMSMATSIESRVPLLDHTFVEFASRVPDHLKIRNGSGKYIFKKAVEDVIPPEVITRKKMGFPTPLRTWLQDEKAAPMFAALEDKHGFLADYLDLRTVSEVVRAQRSGHADATDRLWRLLNLQIWGDTFIAKRPGAWEGMFAATHS